MDGVTILDDRVLEDEYEELYQEQLLLGQYSPFFGFFHQDWLVLQERYLDLRSLPRTRNQALLGLKALLTEIFSFLHELWLFRNTQLHGEDGSRLHSFKRLQLLQEIKTLYEDQDKLLYDDRAIFSLPFEDRERHTVPQLKHFLRFAQSVARISTKQAEELGKGFRKIDYYFKPRQQPIRHDLVCAILGYDPSVREPD